MLTATRPGNRIILPYPHAGQQIVRRQARRHNWLRAGRRWRKTTLAMALVVEAAAANRGASLVWGAPTYKQVRVCWDETRHALGGVGQFVESRMVAIVPGGGHIQYLSLDDPDNARGLTADGVVIDEASQVQQRAWLEVIRPMLLDTHGWSWCIYTPDGQDWTAGAEQAAADDPESIVWHAPTLGVRITEHGLVREPHPLENPDIPFAEIERLWRTMPERSFRQEILAERIQDGTLFRNVDACSTAVLLPGAAADHNYVIAIDWARTNDFTVLCVLDHGTREQVAIDRFTGISYEQQIGRVRALSERFRTRVLVPERNALGDPLCERLAGLGYRVHPWTMTNLSKQRLIDDLSLAFERSLIHILPDQVQRGELLAYQGERLPGGMMRYSAPEGMHDDTVIALALAWQACKPRESGVQYRELEVTDGWS